jgi:hypothetical protein
MVVARSVEMVCGRGFVCASGCCWVDRLFSDEDTKEGFSLARKGKTKTAARFQRQGRPDDAMAR